MSERISIPTAYDAQSMMADIAAKAAKRMIDVALRLPELAMCADMPAARQAAFFEVSISFAAMATSVIDTDDGRAHIMSFLLCSLLELAKKINVDPTALLQLEAEFNSTHHQVPTDTKALDSISEVCSIAFRN